MKQVNEYSIYREVGYDTMAPDTPGSFGHTPMEYLPDVSRDTISFNWSVSNLSNDVAGFTGTYRLNNGSKLPLTMQPTSAEGSVIKGSANVDVTSIGANQPVEITVRAYDLAGNLSLASTYLTHTKASMGTVEVLNGGYDAVSQSHFIQWDLTNAGTANTHVLEYGTFTNDEFVIDGTLPLVNNQFTLSGLTRHQELYYRLVALNASGDRTCSATPTYVQVPNEMPTTPLLTFPTNYSNGNPQFNFEECSDLDGDSLDYYFYFAAGYSRKSKQLVAK